MTCHENDFLHGAKEIAGHLGITTRRAFYLCETRAIPVGKIGEKWVARRSRLDAFIDEQMTKAAGDEAA